MKIAKNISLVALCTTFAHKHKESSDTYIVMHTENNK